MAIKFFLAAYIFFQASLAGAQQNRYRILFTSVRDGVKNLFTMNPDGTDEKQVTQTGKDYEVASFSPDGKHILFVRGENKTKPIYDNPTLEIYTMLADGTGEKRLTFNNDLDYTPAWSPDGKFIYFTRKGRWEQIFRMTPDGGNQIAVTDTNTVNVRPIFSYDGNRITFHTYRHGNDNPELYVMQKDGSRQTRLTVSPGSDYESSFSPGGKYFVFSSDRHVGSSQIYLMNADGSGVKKLTSMKEDCWNAYFSPDGKQIIFQSGNDKFWQLYSMKPDGTNVKRMGNERFSNYAGTWYTAKN